MAEQPEQYTLIRRRLHTHTVGMAFVQPSLMCLFILSVYGLLCGCDSETESDLQLDTSMASVIRVTGETAVSESLWFTSSNWRIENGAIVGTEGHAAALTEGRYPTVAVTLTKHSGRLVLGYLGRDIRTGYDPNESPDPLEDWVQTRIGYAVEFTEQGATLTRGTEAGAVVLAEASALDASARSGGVSIVISGALTPDGQYERLTVSVDGATWFDVLVPEPLEQGRPWIQIDGRADIAGIDIALEGPSTSVEPLGIRGVRGVVAFAQSPVDSERLWLASAYASVGVMRSDDGGGSFKQVYGGLHFLSLAPGLEDSALILVGDKIGQIHRSTNAGLSWDVVRRVPVVEDKQRSVGIFGLAFDPTTLGRVVAASATGDVLQSMDSGQTWTEDGGLPGASCMVMRRDGVVFVGTEEGVYRASTEGVESIPGGPQAVVAVAVADNTVYAGGADGLYQLQDNRFERLTPFPEVLVSALAAVPNSSDLAVASQAGIHRWNSDGLLQISDDTRDTVALLALDNGYLVASPDPGHYQEYFQAFDPLVSGPKEGALFSVSQGGGWSALPVDEPDGGAIAVDATGLHVMSAGRGSRGIYVSNDGGSSFRHEVASEARYIQQVAVPAENPELGFLVSAVGAYRSSDSGLSWQPISEGAYFSSLATTPLGTDVWLGTSTVAPAGVDEAGGSVAGIERDDIILYRSKDAGNTVDEVFRLADARDDGASLSAIAIRSPDEVFATIRVDTGDDLGGLWKITNGNGERLHASSDFAAVAVDPNDANRVVVASGDGVWLSVDAGESLGRVSREWTESVTFTDDSRWVAGGEGVLLMGDASTEQRFCVGLRGRTVESVAYVPSSKMVLAAVTGLGTVRVSLGE